MNFADTVLQREWDLPFATPRQMMIYTTFQELSTGLNYKNLRRKAIEQGDQALATALSFVARDESAHYHFFQDGVKLYMNEDRDGTLEDMQRRSRRISHAGTGTDSRLGSPGQNDCRRENIFRPDLL